MKQIKIRIGIIALWIIMIATIQAQDVQVNLTFGDRDCQVSPAAGRMFVMPTSIGWGATWTRALPGWTNWGGNLGGITGADAKCNTYAQIWGMPGTYEALLADASLTGANDRLTKHWDDPLVHPVTGNNYPGTTLDGDVLKVRDAFSGIAPRTNIGGTALEYADVVLLPDGTKMDDAMPNSGSPELVHGYLTHQVTPPNIPAPDPTNTCGGWTNNTSGTAWAAGWVGAAPSGIIGAFPLGGLNYYEISCSIGNDHGIFCIGK